MSFPILTKLIAIPELSRNVLLYVNCANDRLDGPQDASPKKRKLRNQDDWPKSFTLTAIVQSIGPTYDRLSRMWDLEEEYDELLSAGGSTGGYDDWDTFAAYLFAAWEAGTVSIIPPSGAEAGSKWDTLKIKIGADKDRFRATLNRDQAETETKSEEAQTSLRDAYDLGVALEKSNAEIARGHQVEQELRAVQEQLKNAKETIAAQQTRLKRFQDGVANESGSVAIAQDVKMKQLGGGGDLRVKRDLKDESNYEHFSDDDE